MTNEKNKTGNFACSSLNSKGGEERFAITYSGRVQGKVYCQLEALFRTLEGIKLSPR